MAYPSGYIYEGYFFNIFKIIYFCYNFQPKNKAKNWKITTTEQKEKTK